MRVVTRAAGTRVCCRRHLAAGGVTTWRLSGRTRSLRVVAKIEHEMALRSLPSHSFEKSGTRSRGEEKKYIVKKKKSSVPDPMMERRLHFFLIRRLTPAISWASVRPRRRRRLSSLGRRATEENHSAQPGRFRWRGLAFYSATPPDDDNVNEKLALKFA